MLGFMNVTNRKPKTKSKKNRAACGRTLHADTVSTYAISHSRVPYTNISGRDITTLEVFYTHWSYNAALEWTPTSSISVRAALEYPAGTMTPLFDESGNRDITIAGGGIGAVLLSSGVTIPNGAVYYIRTRCISSGGDGAITRAYIHNATYEGGTVLGYMGTTNDGSDYTLSGAQPTLTGKAYGPTAICSRETGNKPRFFAICGDSISRGGQSGGVSLSEVGIAAAGYSYVNFSFSGAKLQSNTIMPLRRNLMRALGVTDIVMNYPVNDLINSRTIAQIQTDFTTLWTNLKSDGIQKIIQATCLPYTTDATSPGTIVTTPTGAFTGGAASYRSQINAWLRSVVGQAQKPDYIFEFADVLESSRDSGLWLNPATNTPDGLHPSATGATTAGNSLKTLLQSVGF